MQEHNLKDFTSGAILPQLWSLSWPTMMTIFFYTLYNVVDTFWVSKLSTTSIAAVSISQITLFVMLALSMGISVGSSVVMSMHIGAKEKTEASRVLAQGFILATIAGVFFTVLALVFREPFLIASGAIGDIYAPALEYFTIAAAGSILSFYLINIMFAFNSEGDTFTLTKLFALSTAVNVILDPILIFGKFGFPELGIAGAAYATLISQFVFIVLAMRILSSSSRSVHFSFSNLSIQKDSVLRVLKIGFPASLTQVLNPVGLAILILMVSLTYGEAGATAFSLIFRLEFFAYLPAIGFGLGAMSMIGQNTGAGNTHRSLEIFKAANYYGGIASGILGVLLIIFGSIILKIFTDDPLVTEYALSYIYIVALSYAGISITMIVASVFQSMGKSWPGFWLTFIKFFVIAIPLTYFITQMTTLPIWYVWIVISASNIFIAIISYIWNLKVLKRV
ncbi:MATE family efflux transporter [Candidatus Gracilibacteria bacterium]|nr:MATE family efflux transporter [Candidatus Gracilibacteria bacterium]